MHPREKIPRHDAPALVSFLRPRIGKEKMSDRGRGRRKEVRHRIGSFYPQNAHIVDGVASRAAARAADAAAEPLDSEKIKLWKIIRHGDEKRSVAAPQIEFERSEPGKNFPKIEWRKVVCRDQFDRCGSSRKLLVE